MTETTRYVADWVLGLQVDDVPEAVRSVAIDHVVDGYGVALGGAPTRTHQILRGSLALGEGEGEAQVLGTPIRTRADTAALMNGVAMHEMDYDDTQLSTNADSVYGLLTHPTTPVLGAAAAVAEAIGASGQDLLLAYIAGVEVACRVADAMNARHYHDGFHTTGTVGAFGATAAAGKLMRLDAQQFRTSLGIAGGLASGLRENFGTMMKPLHAGNACRAGVLAARLAAGGFSAAENILEAPRGFFAAAAGGYEPRRLDGRLGEPFFFTDPGISIKPYPSGSLSHPGLDAALALVREHGVEPDDVRAATVYTSSAMTNALIHARPDNALEAKFSFPYLLAVAILRRKVGIADFTDSAVRDPQTREMIERCSHVADPEFDARGFQHMETRIEIELTSGVRLDRSESVALGHPSKPMNREQLLAKFAECADRTITRAKADEAASLLLELPTLPGIAELHRLLAAAPDEAAVVSA